MEKSIHNDYHPPDYLRKSFAGRNRDAAMDPLIGLWKVKSQRYIPDGEGKQKLYTSHAVTSNYYLGNHDIIFEEWQDTNPDGSTYLAINLRVYNTNRDTWEVMWIPYEDNRNQLTPIMFGDVNDTGYYVDLPIGSPPEDNRVKFAYQFLSEGHNHWTGSRKVDGSEWFDFWTMEFFADTTISTDKHWKKIYDIDFDIFSRLIGEWEIEIIDDDGNKYSGESSIKLGLGGAALIEIVQSEFDSVHILRILRYLKKMDRWLLITIDTSYDGIQQYLSEKNNSNVFTSKFTEDERKITYDLKGLQNAFIVGNPGYRVNYS